MTRLSDSLLGTHLNSVWMEGTLVSDPEDLTVDEGPPTYSFRIEANQNWEPASVFLVEATDLALGGCRPRLGRGRGVRIIGRLQQRRWVDLDGKLKKEVKIVSELVEPLGTPL